jgi:hypothetical protein
MNARSALSALLTALALGCTTSAPKMPPVVPPPLVTSIAHYAGSSLSGPLAVGVAREIDADPSHAIAIACEITYLESFDEAWLTPLAEHSRLVVTSGGGDPFQATSQLAPRARVGHAEAAHDFLLALRDEARMRSAKVVAHTGVLPRGVTVVFSNAAAPVALENGQPAPRTADVEIARNEDAGDALRVALVLEGPIVDTSREEPADTTRGATARIAAREWVVLDDAPQIDGDPLVLMFPSVLGGTGAFVAVITATSAPKDDVAAAAHRARVESTLSNIGVVGKSTRDRARDISQHEAWQSEVANMRRALETPERRRSALVFLATSTGAALTEDAAYSSSDEELAALAEIALDVTRADDKSHVGPEASRDERQLGWALEQRVYLHFARLVSEEKLPQELAGILLRRAGECGRWADTIEDGVRISKNADELRLHFARENRIFLEDSAPSSRVRAFDWLAARGLAPKGFDPLGSEPDRRRVLAALEDAEEAAAQRPSDGARR